MTPVLRTARLVLRPRVADDAEALFPTMSDAEAMRWWSGPPFESVAALRDQFATLPPGRRAWAVCRGDGPALGFVSTGERRPGVAEIGYLFARAVWGQGIAREAVAAVVTQLLAEGHRRVFADVDPDNGASTALLERLGFTLEGRLRGEWITHIGVRDSLIYGLLRDEWRA